MNAGLANSLTHEVGHTLGLVHTHEGSRGNKANNALCGDCYQESVSRTRTQGIGCISTMGKKKCEVNADCLCDTDGDPLLQNISTRQIYVLANCSGYDRVNSPYKQDRWAADWLPTGNNNAITNLMSYSSSNCRTQMTPMQRGVEYFYALNKGTFAFPVNYVSFYQNDDVDNFENDNFSQNANAINLFTPQQHSFHLVPDQNSAYTGCDVDWVRFIPSCGGTLNVFTSAVAGRSSANTRITLFNQALVQLAQNDNISSTNLYSKISFNFNAGTTYLIRIDNMNANSVGYYNITVGDNAISGNDVLCTPSTYSFPDLPTGATVQWSSSPAGSVSFNPTNARVTTASNLSNGSIITATINCNGINYIVSKPVQTSTPTPGITILGIQPYPGTQMDVQVNTTMQPPYSWYVDGVLARTTNSTTTTISSGNNCGVTHTLSVTVSGPCGSSSASQTFQKPCSGSGFAIAPNPATNTVEVTALAGVSKNISYQRTITEVKLYDNTGNLKKTQKLNKFKKATINLSGFKTGVYIVEVSDDDYKERHQLIIAK